MALETSKNTLLDAYIKFHRTSLRTIETLGVFFDIPKLSKFNPKIYEITKKAFRERQHP